MLPAHKGSGTPIPWQALQWNAQGNIAMKREKIKNGLIRYRITGFFADI